jgi:hypothetical protein
MMANQFVIVLALLSSTPGLAGAPNPTIVKCRIAQACDGVPIGSDCIAIGAKRLDITFNFSRQRFLSKPEGKPLVRGVVEIAEASPNGTHSVRMLALPLAADAVFSDDWRQATILGNRYICSPAE